MRFIYFSDSLLGGDLHWSNIGLLCFIGVTLNSEYRSMILA